ncbi:MAG: hypothetical protein ACRD2L_16615, partial [Terriglobia bacterium]
MKVRNLRYWILAADLLWVWTALQIAAQLRYAASGGSVGVTKHFPQFLPIAFAATIVWTFLYFHMHVDGFQGGWHLPTVVSRVMAAVSFLIVLLLVFAFPARHDYSRLVLLYFAFLFPLGLV